MSIFQPGLVHTPVTPFTRDRRIDYDAFGRMLDFHIRQGADTLALPMHAGESVSLSDAEKRAVLQFAITHVAGRVPVIAHVSDSGTAITVALARYAETIGAAAAVATTPYYWTPPPAMILDHFAQIAAAVRIPFLVHNAPDDMAGAKVTADLMLELAVRAESFAGVVDSGLDWQFMIELVSKVGRNRPDFLLVAGNEYMVSAGAIGATGMFSALAGVAPKLVRKLHDLCQREKYGEARGPQEQAAALRHLLKPGGVAGLRAAMRVMGRETGAPRAPVMELAGTAYEKLAAELDALPALRDEPQGW